MASKVIQNGVKIASKVPLLGRVFRIKPWFLDRLSLHYMEPREGIFGWLAVRKMIKINSFLEKNAVKFSDIKPDHTVLEIGFGPGVGLGHAYNIIKGGKGRVYGLDESDRMLEKVTKDYAKCINDFKITVFEGNAEGIPLNTNSMDRVFHCNCYYFWPSMRNAMREIYRVMKPGGLMITTLDMATLHKQQKNGILKYGHPDPVKYMTCLEKYGFENVKMEYHKDADTGKDFQVIFASITAKPAHELEEEELDDPERALLRKMIAIEKKYGLIAKDDLIDHKAEVKSQMKKRKAKEQSVKGPINKS